MKALIIVLIILLSTSVAAETTPVDSLKDIKDFVLGMNPIILVIAGLVLYFASNLAKLVAIILILVGAASLIMQFI
jgi:hypothetical protein